MALRKFVFEEHKVLLNFNIFLFLGGGGSFHYSRPTERSDNLKPPNHGNNTIMGRL